MGFQQFRRPITAYRISGGEYVRGVWQQGEPELLPLRGSVQPTTPEDMQMLPEGRRQFASYRIYSDTALRTASEAEDGQPGVEPDVVMIDGQPFEVMQVWEWKNGIISHYKHLVARMQRPFEVPSED